MKRSISIVLALIMCLCCVSVVSAETQESDLVRLEERKSVVMWVSWDTHKPTVVFVAPDGTEYDPTQSREDTAVMENGKDLYYVIQNAQAGQWRVRLDKGTNKQVDISVHNYEPGITVEYFNIGKVENDRIPVKFRAKGKEGQWFQYRISAMIDHTGMEKELASGYAGTDREYELDVRLNSLSSYNAYMLKLYIWYDDNGTDVFDVVFSDTFAYTNSSVDGKATDFSLMIEPETQQLYVSWEELEWSADSVMVAVFENGAAEPAVFDEFTKDRSPVKLSYDPVATEVAVEFTVKYNGVNAAPVRKTVKLGGQTPISLQGGELSNSLQLPMSYQGLHQQAVLITVNDKTTELILDSSGKVNITLEEGWNAVQVRLTDGAGITWQIARDIYVDRQAPVLNMSRPYDGMIIDEESILISGTVLDSEKVLINGQAVPVDGQNGFAKEVSLSQGANTILVVATDGAGNETRYTATVVRGKTDGQVITEQQQNADPGRWYTKLLGEGSYWVLLTVSGLCLAVIGYALVFWRKQRTPEEKQAHKEEKEARKEARRAKKAEKKNKPSRDDGPAPDGM